MQVPIGYVVTIITVLAGAVAVLFRMYVSSQEKLLNEKEEKYKILLELMRHAEEIKRRRETERREKERNRGKNDPVQEDPGSRP